ncbi:MAG: hypothetical protein MZV65_07000 [Chromatiales bacterium]|nr:hypothetical protein [Chromatiales bacterium]
MKIKKEHFWDALLIAAFFFSFSGYYALLIIFSNIVGTEFSRQITIPLRLFIVFCLVLFFLSRPNFKVQKSLFFHFFSFAYLIRIIYEMFGGVLYHISTNEFLLYFLSFVLIPITIGSQIKLTEKHYNQIFFSILFGCTIVSVATTFFYNDIIGSVVRITDAVGATSDNFISPLALSYVSVLGICSGAIYLLTNNKTAQNKYFIAIAIAIATCLVPFFLARLAALLLL